MVLEHDRLELITQNLSEVVTIEELKSLLASKKAPKAYVGLEPSGLVHLGQGVLCANKVKDLVQAGCKVTILLADWHAFINDKLNGILERIKLCGEYVKDCFLALGIDRNKVNFVYVSDLVKKDSYWERTLRITKCFSLARLKRAMTIMGRREEEAELDSSKIIYPAMQCADMFELKVDIAFGGMDQRKAHMLAREAAEKLNWKKPIALHTPLLPGLEKTLTNNSLDMKMSKSRPESCIFIHDTEKDIETKILGAYCPPKDISYNPIIDICRYILFPHYKKLEFNRKALKPLVASSEEELLNAYFKGELHPLDLKLGVIAMLIELLAPVREYFKKFPKNLELVQEFVK
jgi:tyrosyl-tRNA synthetase